MPFFELAPKRALVVAPHADDEVLDAGGLIARLCGSGWEVHLLYATVSGYPSRVTGASTQTEGRTAELEAALGVLGVAGYDVIYRGEDQHLRLDTVPQAGLIEHIESAVAWVRPYLAVIPCFGHYHQDHRAVFRACVAALRPAPDGIRPFVPTVLAYGHGAAGWGGYPHTFHPTVFADITEVIDVKVRALECYASQVGDPPHLRSIDKVLSWSAAWGNQAGVAHAEPFECIRLAVL